MKLFLKNLILRESCYNCKFKGNNRISDITMADFWGIEKIHKEFDDDKGVSAIIINTNKGIDIFSLIENKLNKIKIKYEEINNNNICLENSSKINKYRKNFIEDLRKGKELDKIDEKYFTGE